MVPLPGIQDGFEMQKVIKSKLQEQKLIRLNLQYQKLNTATSNSTHQVYRIFRRLNRNQCVDQRNNLFYHHNFVLSDVVFSKAIYTMKKGKNLGNSIWKLTIGIVFIDHVL
jgi:hypothetical protein